MRKLINIKNNNLSLNKNIFKKVLDPEFVFVEVPEKYMLKVKINSYIYKNDILLSNEINNIYSPISGIVKGIKKVKSADRVITSIKIENDFKEKEKSLISSVKRINKLSKKEATSLINDYLDDISINSDELLIISALDLDPFEINYKYILNAFTTELLEAIDALVTIFNLETAVIIIPSDDNEISHKLINLIGTYNNITYKLTENVYPYSNKKLLLEKYNYNKDVNFFTAQEMYNIYKVLKKKKPISEKIISFKFINHNINFILEVKYGILIIDVINSIINEFDQNYDVIVNGLLQGCKIDEKETVITDSINSIFITEKLNLKEEDCINCGACHLNCPLGLDPKNEISFEKCIKCGICEFNCPSNRVIIKREKK